MIADVPAYRALYERLRMSILNGQLGAGARLPPSRSLAAETGLSRNTVLAAFAQLHSECYITGRQGSGTYVAKVLPGHLLRAPAGPKRFLASVTSPAAKNLPGRLVAHFLPFQDGGLLGRRSSLASRLWTHSLLERGRESILLAFESPPYS